MHTWPMQGESQMVPELRGRGMEGSPLEFLQQQATGGNADAQFELGRRYEQGPLGHGPLEGLEQNVRRAHMWYTRAAGQGHAPAQASVERTRYDYFCKTWCSVPQVRLVLQHDFMLMCLAAYVFSELRCDVWRRWGPLSFSVFLASLLAWCTTS